MIGALLSGFFKIVMELMGTLVQILLSPINALFSSIAPQLSQNIIETVNGLTSAISQISFPLSFIPQPIKTALIFIFTTEIALFAIFKSTRLTAKLWTVIQKIKLW